jgi:ATP-dependent DNA helicase RecQ
VAFGLGLDLPKVTLVVHWDAVTSVQMYVQQIGRAGRTGEASLCLTMFDERHLDNAIKRALRECGNKEQLEQLVSEAKEVCRLRIWQYVCFAGGRDSMHLT